MIKKIGLTVLIVALLLTGVLVTSKLFFPPSLVVPISGPSVVATLGATLEKEHLFPSGPFILQGDTIEATISGVRVLLSKEKDFFSQARALQLVLSQLTMNANSNITIKEIDLRFNKVIIR